jgi:hypothetical protein
MNTLYTIAGSSSGPSSTVIPMLMLTAAVASIVGLAISIGRWKARRGYINRFKTHSSR